MGVASCQNHNYVIAANDPESSMISIKLTECGNYQN